MIITEHMYGIIKFKYNSLQATYHFNKFCTHMAHMISIFNISATLIRKPKKRLCHHHFKT